MTTRKCKFCGEPGYIEDMHQITLGVPKSCQGWYHLECVKPFLKQREIIDEDNRQKAELSDLIKDIHEVVQVPKWMWSLFDAWRKGNTQPGFKKPKKPLEYRVITQAYKLAKKDIRWAKTHKSFQNSNAEIKYCYAIMMNKINDAYKKVQQKDREKMTVNVENNVSNISTEQQVKYKHKDSSGDISSFIDD